MLENQEIFVVTQKDPDMSEPEQQDLYRIGTIVTVKQLLRLPKNIFRVLVEGTARAELIALDDSQGYLQSEVTVFEDQQGEEIEEHRKQAMLRNLKEIFGEYAGSNPKVSKELTAQVMDAEELSRMMDEICINIPLYYEEKQKLLEAVYLQERYDLLCVMLSNEVEIMHIKAELQAKVKERVDKISGNICCGSSFK